MNEPEVIFEECSPNGNIWAVVEQDDETCYFYLHSDPSLNVPMRTCWLRNLKTAPLALDVLKMREGRPPMQPQQYCRNPEGLKPLTADELSIIWSEEGDGAALCKDDEIISILERGSISEEVDGYSLECRGAGPLSHDLDLDSDSYRRFLQAKDYWDSWTKASGPWPDYQQAGLDVFNESWGAYSNYYAIDGGNWPPKALLRFNRQHSTLLITLGMGLRAQPAIELYDEDFPSKRRIELAIYLGSEIPDKEVNSFASYLSGQSSFPWSFATFLSQGHTLPADVLAEASGGKFSYFLLDTKAPITPPVTLPKFRDEPVTVLWLRPISERERNFAEQNGSTEIITLLNQLSLEVMYSLNRPEVI